MKELGILVKIVFVPFCILTILLSLTFFEFISSCNLYFDGIFYNTSYSKILIELNNVDYFQSPDSYSGSYQGSFKKDEAEIVVNFGDAEEHFYLGSKLQNDFLKNNSTVETKYHYIWYRKGLKKAFPALPNEKVFPVWKRIHKRLWLFYIWLFCLFMTFILWKIGVKMGFMKNKINEE